MRKMLISVKLPTKYDVMIIYALGLVHGTLAGVWGEIPAGWASGKERLSRSKLKQAFLIDSDAELFMNLIQCIRFRSWKVLNRA